jgi:predicted phage terminase large subunit-like protein
MITKQEAAKRLLSLRNAEETFAGFVKLHHPKFNLASFQIDLINKLDAVERGKIKRLMINMPPRHGKSFLASCLFPVYYVGRNPERAVMCVTYNSELSMTFGRQVRQYAKDPNTSQAFNDLELSADSRAVDHWGTTKGGVYYSIGLGGTTTGRRANLLIIDDPIKSREDADSAIQRNKVWDYYVASLLTRLQPLDDQQPAVICIATRWHPDDLCGRIQKQEDWYEWEHVNFPAIIEKESKDEVRNPEYAHLPLSKVSRYKRYMKVKKEYPLWEERFPMADLRKMEKLNPREFAALYQQSPYIKGGNMIKTEWWKYYNTEDIDIEKFPTIIIACDTAFKKTTTADYSVAVVAGLDNQGDIYIIDIKRGRWDFPELKRKLINMNTKWRGKGLRGIHIEDKASGQSLIQELKNQSGLAVIPYKVSVDKVSRVAAITDLIEGGRVFLNKSATWLDDFLEESVGFPNGSHDDQIDALTIALDKLSRMSFNAGELETLPITSHGSLQSEMGKTDWQGWGE